VLDLGVDVVVAAVAQAERTRRRPQGAELLGRVGVSERDQVFERVESVRVSVFVSEKLAQWLEQHYIAKPVARRRVVPRPTRLQRLHGDDIGDGDRGHVP
jgi:hypothetical protein